MVSSGSFGVQSRSIVATMQKSRASILRDLAQMQVEGHSLINLHVSGYYYVPTQKWPTTHPKQLEACLMRMDSKVEERWACWACLIPMDKSFPQITGKTTFCTAKAQCYHWWEKHASQSCWDLIEDFAKYKISHSDMMTALGIDLKEFPLPVGTALTRIPTILPSHEAGHDPRITEAPWKRKVAWASHPSERLVPWAGRVFRQTPRPPSYPPPSYEKSSEDYPPHTLQQKDSSMKSSDYPPSSSQDSSSRSSRPNPQEEKENLMLNRKILKELSDAGILLMPDAAYYSEGVLTSLGWVDPLEVFYNQMIPELKEVCVGRSSVGDYGAARRAIHAEVFGNCEVAATLLRLEEHAFYVVVIKMAATIAMAEPDRLSPDQRMCAGSLMAFCPGALKQCVEMSKDDFESLPSPREAEKVQSYCVRMCDLAIPLRPMQVPGPPFLMPSQNMSRKQMAALLM